MADRPEMFGTMQNVVGPTLVTMATKFRARRGHPYAYRLVVMLYLLPQQLAVRHS